MVERRILRAEQYERIGTLPGLGIDVGLAAIGALKALITWGQGVPAEEVGTRYGADEYVILGEDGQWAERIICRQDGFGLLPPQERTVNFVLKDPPDASEAGQMGWVACDYGQGDRLDEVPHGEIRASFEEAQRDAEENAYEGIRYAGPDGYLYMGP
jgi:hypothetical protein